MEEINYTVLYKIVNLDTENYYFIFKPCYVVKGFYDKENEVFLDEINIERYSYDNAKCIYSENEYCVGEIYNESELRQKFPDANSLEDVQIKLFEDAESKMTIGTIDIVNNVVNINNVLLDDLNTNKQSIENNSFRTFEELEEKSQTKFVVLTPNQIDNILSFSNEENIFGYLEQVMKDYDTYGVDKNVFNKYENTCCVNSILLRKALEERNIEFVKSIIEQYYSLLDNAEIKDDTVEISLIDPDNIKRINDEEFKKIVNSNDIEEVKKDLSVLLDIYKDNLYNLQMMKDGGCYLYSSMTYFNVQVQCLNDMLNKNDLDEIKKYYLALYRTTRNSIDRLTEELDTLGKSGIAIEREEYKEAEEKNEEDINDAIDDAMSKLNELVGLENVKNTFEEIFSTMLFKKRTEENLNLENGNKHMVFIGNPGTGKTTVAEIAAPLFHKLGYLNSDKVSYVAAQDLIGKYVGQTAPKTEEIIKKNRGGLIVLDEAYILAGPAQQFGNEAITVMIKEMEKNNTMFIFAGYKKEMEDFIKMNSGIESRIGTFVEFNDYTEEELLEIFKLTVNKTNKSENQDYKLKVSPEVIKKVKEIIHQARGMEDFGNGRFIKKLFTMISREHAKNTRNITDIDELYTITEKDISPDILDKMFFDRNSGSDYKGSNIGFNAKIKTLTKTK